MESCAGNSKLETRPHIRDTNERREHAGALRPPASPCVPLGSMRRHKDALYTAQHAVGHGKAWMACASRG